MFCGEAGLAKYVGQSPFGQSTMLRNYSPKVLCGGLFLEGDVAALLSQLDESGALEGAHEALSGDARKLRHLPRDFDNGPERLLLGGAFLRAAPRFEVKLNRLAEIRARGFYVFTLRRYIEFRTTRHVQSALFRDKRGEAVGHVQMLMEANRGSKAAGLKD